MKQTTKKTTKSEGIKKAVRKQSGGPVTAAMAPVSRELTTTAPIPKPVAAPAPMPEACKAAAPTPKPGKITLQLVKPGAAKVLVAGTFNGWKPETTPLTPVGNGRWTGSLEVKPGRYEYLFVVDGTWIPDPNATETVANPFGGLNSVLNA